jgi:hypothetical protein
MAFYHKWDVKTGFTFSLQFFMLISDGLGGVIFVCLKCLLFKEVHVQIFLLSSINSIGPCFFAICGRRLVVII